MLKRNLTALTGLAGLGLAALPSVALAEPIPDPESTDGSGGECDADGDCPSGYVCEVTGGSSCACEANTPCDCAPTEWRSCVPGPCASDADCGEGLVCVSYEVPCATAAPCSSDGECEPAPPCEGETKSICAPRWVLPCEAAADCGEGFTCEPTQVCTCNGGGATDPAPTPDSGSGSSGDSGSSDHGAEGDGAVPPREPGSDGSDGSESPMPPEGDCTCEPGDTNVCVAIETPCTDDAQCPSGWSCSRYEVDVACTEPATPPGEGGGSDGSSGEVPPDGDRDACPPSDPLPPSTGVCFPRYGGEFDSGIPRGEDASTDAPQYESGTASPVDPSSNEGGSGDGTGTSGTNVEPSGGCAGGGAAAVPVASLALLVAAMWRRRRTARLG